MINQKLLELIQKEAIIQKERLDQRVISDKEVVIMVPTRFSFNDIGFLDRVSALNTQAYFRLNAEIEKEYCSVCGNQVEDKEFITNTNGQKMHIDCYIKNKTAHE